jgi:hypothetical protein
MGLYTHNVKQSKMKLRLHAILFLMALVLMMIACSSEDGESTDGSKLQGATKPYAMNSSQVLVLTQEALDITANLLSSEGISIGGETGSPEDCEPALSRQYVKDVTHYDTTIYSGSLVLNYGDGSSCTNETVRTGSISSFFTYIINYRDTQTYSARQTISFENFVRDSARLDGEFSTISKTGFPDTIKINAARITYPNGSFVQLSATFVSERVYDGTTYTRKVTGHLASSQPDGNFYNADIIEPMEYSYDCSGAASLIPVKGKIKLELGTWNATINYGDGACDRTYTVTIKGDTQTYAL